MTEPFVYSHIYCSAFAINKNSKLLNFVKECNKEEDFLKIPVNGRINKLAI